ncbi:hypothetical protein R1flu_010557 [Riccia fluitans]|uniref:Uncharacterized protein n=1 Tax=Riccia fluitans TaxID=41844 RepID=A0ABD1Z5H4_9MARC
MQALGLQIMGHAAFCSSPVLPPWLRSGLNYGAKGSTQRKIGSGRLLKVAKIVTAFAVSREKTNGGGLSPQEFFESFLRRRQADGDFVSKASDLLWKKETLELDEEKRAEVRQKLAELQKMKEVEDTGSFLKLTQAKNWSAGIEDVAPRNSNAAAEERARASDDRKRQSLLEYEALKRELSLITLLVAGLCTLYCLVVLSLESTLSYDIGAGASLLYLQLLYRQADKLGEGSVAAIFKPKRFKKKNTGIRSEDVKETLEKSIKGTAMALSSPRLVIPAALFGLWSVSAKITGTTGFHLEVAPMMFGFFAYKAAALVQAYRDNKELVMLFEKNEEETIVSLSGGRKEIHLFLDWKVHITHFRTRIGATEAKEIPEMGKGVKPTMGYLDVSRVDRRNSPEQSVAHKLLATTFGIFPPECLRSSGHQMTEDIYIFYFALLSTFTQQLPSVCGAHLLY